MAFTQHHTLIGGNLVGNKISLSGNQSKDVKKVQQLMLDTMKTHRKLWRKELNDWQFARQARYSTEMPRNHFLQEVYEDVMMDGHLTGITENRTLRTTNKDFIICDENGAKSDAHSKFIKDKTWFEDLINYAHKSTYYGTTVVFLNNMMKGEIKGVKLVDRSRVIPELGLILGDYSKNEGLPYRDYADLLIECQMYDHIGILEKAAPYTILKRHSWGSWDEFEELFGVPIRIAKIASQSEVVKNEVAGWLEEMGSAPYGVFPIGTEVEIKENSKGDAFNVFFKKLETLDKELSKLIIHQTMTTENGGSKAQGSVHENTLAELVYADEKKILAILNDRLLPAMRAQGYNIPEGYQFKVSQTKDPSAQILIDKELMNNGYKLKKEYIEETYGVELDDAPDSKIQENEPPAKKP